MRVFEPETDDEAEQSEAWKEYADREGLVPTNDESHDRPIYRRPGFEGIKTVNELDERVSVFIKAARERAKLLQKDVAPLLGLSIPVFGRYERNMSSMSVSRMVIMAEQLGFHPTEFVFHVAPHLWGETPEAASGRAELAMKIAELPEDVIDDLAPLVDKMHELYRLRNKQK